MSWTDEKVELLRQLWLDGRSASQISTALGHGLTRNAVIGKVHRLGLSGRAKTAASGSSGVPRAAPSRRMAARAATEDGVTSGSHESGGGGIVSSGRVVQGNTVLAVMRNTAIEAAPARAKEVVVVPMSLRVTIVELKEAMCRWPLGDPASAEFRYCGSPSSSATPYCSHHGKLAYQPVQDRRRERDRDRRTLIAR